MRCDIVKPEHRLVNGEGDGDVDDAAAPARHVLAPLQPGARPLPGASRPGRLLHHHPHVVRGSQEMMEEMVARR